MVLPTSACWLVYGTTSGVDGPPRNANWPLDNDLLSQGMPSNAAACAAPLPVGALPPVRLTAAAAATAASRFLSGDSSSVRSLVQHACQIRHCDGCSAHDCSLASGPIRVFQEPLDPDKGVEYSMHAFSLCSHNLHRGAGSWECIIPESGIRDGSQKRGVHRSSSSASSGMSLSSTSRRLSSSSNAAASSAPALAPAAAPACAGTAPPAVCPCCVHAARHSS